MTTDRQAPDDGPEPQPDVLVVGAGPAGLTLAAQLHSFGARVRLVDRQLDRVHESRALAIQPRTLEVLAGLGVTQTLVGLGNTAVQVRLHAGHRVVSIPLYDTGVADTAYQFLLFLSQAETERVLGKQLQRRGVPVERGVELAGIDQPGPAQTSLTCRLRHRDGQDETIRVRYLAGCDGANSTVRRLAGIPFEGRAYPQTFLLADLEVDGLDAGAAHTYLADPGMLFFFPLGTPATWRMLTLRPPVGSGGESPVTLAQLQAIADQYTGGRLRLRDPVWISDFRVHNRGAARYRTGPVFLAGDAAHVHSPAGAQGMNTGIQDAVNLGWKLALTTRGLAAPTLLDTYEPERAPVGQKVRRFTDRPFTIATSHHPLPRLARTQLAPRLAPLAARLTPARAAVFRTISELGIRYRHSPASTEGPRHPRRGPKAGDRLPDAPLVRDSQPTTLHAELAAPSYHLLLCGPARCWPAPTLAALTERWPSQLAVRLLTRDATPGGLHDPAGTALARLGCRPDRAAHYLIRPDGHIGYRALGADLAGLHHYLTRWLTPASAG